MSDLVAVASEINREHEAARAAARSTVEHARRAGERLIAAKAELGHGEWLPWIQANLTFSERTAQMYMRITRRLAELGDVDAQRVADLPLRDAMTALSLSVAIADVPDEAAEEQIAAGRVSWDLGGRTWTDLGSIPISEVKVLPRRRRSHGDLLNLMASVDRVGLLNPIVVDESLVLVCGWRRLEACRSLGWEEIHAISAGSVTAEERWDFELAENTLRESYSAEEREDEISYTAR